VFRLVYGFNLVYNRETKKILCTQVVSKLESTLSLIESAYLEKNNSKEHHRIGLLSKPVFCSNGLYTSTSAENPSKSLIC
jgi:hypothetical protein